MANAALNEQPVAPAQPEAFELYENVPKPKMVPVLLERHYRPEGEFEIIGHWKSEVKEKNAAGKEIILSEREFIKNEPMPPPMAGVGGASTKLWAGTMVRLSVAEAKAVKNNRIGSIEVDD